jgi:molybdopterin synthase catalytic subunit
MTVKFSEEPIDPTSVYRLLEENDSGAVGSVLLHFAVVKVQTGDGGKTVGIEYRAKGDVEEELEAIANTLRGRWRLNDVVLLRRSGKVCIGEIISLVAVNSPNSQDAFEASQFAIECLKKMSTIAKKEVFAA